jgi:hypothetical protein
VPGILGGAWIPQLDSSNDKVVGLLFFPNFTTSVKNVMLEVAQR